MPKIIRFRFLQNAFYRLDDDRLIAVRPQDLGEIHEARDCDLSRYVEGVHFEIVPDVEPEPAPAPAPAPEPEPEPEPEAEPEAKPSKSKGNK